MLGSTIEKNRQKCALRHIAAPIERQVGGYGMPLLINKEHLRQKEPWIAGQQRAVYGLRCSYWIREVHRLMDLAVTQIQHSPLPKLGLAQIKPAADASALQPALGQPLEGKREIVGRFHSQCR